MLKQHIVCFEHEKLYPAGSAIKPASGLREIPQSLFDELFDQLTQNLKGWLVRDWHGQQAVLKTRQYIGIVQGKCGHVLEILPKTAQIGQTPEQMRFMVLKMLQALPDMPFKTFNQQAMVQAAKVPLHTLFVQQALACILTVLQGGLKQHYQTVQSNQAVLRGRLLIQQQLRYNHSNQARFYGEHDEYHTNCAENRILKLALTYIRPLVHTNSTQQLIHYCLQHMSTVPVSSHIEQDFRMIRLDRYHQYYASALQWAKLIIDGFSPSAMHGGQPALSLLFDMNKLFENIVACQLQQHLSTGWHLKKQQHTASLLQVNCQPQGRLQPDLLLFDQQHPVVVLDCKWKIKSGTTFHQLQPDEQELYQMFAYAAAYLPKGGTVCLIYPKTSQFGRAVEQAEFQHLGDTQVHLWLLPFCLERFQLIDAPFLLLNNNSHQS